MKTERLTSLALLSAAALMLSWVESLLPAFSAVPGVKIGLANTMGLFALFMLSPKDAWIVTLIRIALSSLLFGSLFSLLYSVSGALVSLSVMCLMRSSGIFSVSGVSVAGAVSHNAGQILCAMIVMQTKGLVYYMAPLVVSGTAAGLAVGALSALLLKKIPQKYFRNIG